MAHTVIEQILQQSGRLGLRPVAGPTDGTAVTRVEITALADIGTLEPRTLAIVDAVEPPASYRIDIAIRQASALELGGLVLPAPVELSMTAGDLADRGGVPILEAAGATGSDLAVAVDRMLGSGDADVVGRARFAMQQVRQAAHGRGRSTEPGTADRVLAAASEALGGTVRLQDDPQVRWDEDAAVFIGEVPKGRIVHEPAEDGVPTGDTTALVLPVVASVLSRVLLREVQHRFSPRQTAAELLAQLVVAESARVEPLANQAYQRGFPLQLSHAAAWVTLSHPREEHLHPPRALQSALELFALELFEPRRELWHIAFVHDDVLVVSSERAGSGDHQRRVREVTADIADHAQILVGGEWAATVGLGTPQVGAAGLRQSATEARIAAETAIASGRAGHIVATDVTGLRRVLLDFYASPTSRELLEDVLRPLDAQGPQKAETAVRTLLAYLSHRGSPARAAKELTLHPNAVSYRIRNIADVLQLDLHDPDTRFALELACRVRLLSAERT